MLRKGRWSAAVATVLVAAGSVVGCGASGTPPSEVVVNYVNALAEGNFSIACSMLPSAARSSFAKSIGTRVTCAEAFNRCVPRQPANTAQDQTQLLYANVQTTITRTTAVSYLSGTAVARAVEQVTLVERRGVWTLSSYGEGLRRCALAIGRSRRGTELRG